MRRIKDIHGQVHYGCPADYHKTLCGCRAFDIAHTMFDTPEREPWLETTERVTCPDCAKVVCAVRNEPYNTLVADIDYTTLETGITAAVQADGPVETTKEK